MSSSNFRTNPRIPLIGDASVVINLIATGRALEIIAALAHPFAVTENAYAELREGASKGHNDFAELTKLIAAGLVTKVNLSEAALTVYEQLVDGSSARTLDDGEAATIAHAHAVSAVPLLDERKARSLCAASFPNLGMLCSAELLMDPALAAKFGSQGQIDLIVNALKIGRMRVPPEHVAKIRSIIGEDNAAQCPSLPKVIRPAARST
jgi:predicted nucleic acid-binding protein